MNPEETRGICGDIGGEIGATSGDELGSAGGLKFCRYLSCSGGRAGIKYEDTDCFLALPVNLLQQVVESPL